ncbi:hypothetical protein KY289_016840 [Solanum tuberosum]|nr:hypothetical protein KY289_016840 [Solanum tuberosum]
MKVNLKRIKKILSKKHYLTKKNKTIHEECKMQSRQVKWNQGSSSKSSMTEEKDVDNHVQQKIQENAMFSSNIIDLTIKQEKEDVKKKKSEEHDEGKFKKNQEDSFKKTLSNKERRKTIHEECKMQSGQVKWNQGSSSKSSMTEGKDVDNHVQQKIRENAMFSSNIIDLTIKKEKEDAKKKTFEEHNESKSKKDQEDSLKKTLPNKEKQKTIHECKMQSGQVKWNPGSSLTSLMTEGKDLDNHLQQEIRENAMFSSDIIDLTIKLVDKNKKKTYKKVTQNERLEEKKEIKKQREQSDFFEEKIPQNQQQQQECDINGKPELNRVTCEDSLSDNFGRILKDSNANYGSKLWRRDEKDGNYCIMKGIPRSIKFRSINNLYKCTNRISPVDDEYTWNLSSDEDSIMILSIKEEPSIITDEDNVGCKRKWRENQKTNGEKDATTSST